MRHFTARFGEMIQGAVSGCDRLVFRGSMRQLNHAHGRELEKGLLEGHFDLESQAIDADDVQGGQGQVRAHRQDGAALRMEYQDEADEDAGRAQAGRNSHTRRHQWFQSISGLLAGWFDLSVFGVDNRPGLV